MQKGLFIGGTHIDILANTQMEYSIDSGIDLPGDFTIAIGGTIFNVCVNLKTLGVDCYLVSACKRNSLFTYLIEQVLKNANIKHHLIYPKNAKESAFLAIREKENLTMAVTASAWDNLTDDELIETLNEINKQKYDFVVIDGNVTARHAQLIIECFYAIPIYFCATSSVKLLRFLTLNLSNHNRINAMFLNNLEYNSVLNLFGDFKNEDTMYFVTKAENGVDIYYKKDYINYPAPEIEDVKSFSGAGDAFASGVIYGLQNNYTLENAVKKGYSMVKEKVKFSHSNIIPIELDNVKHKLMEDKLTGVLNRNAFEEDKHILNQFDYVFIIDIDNFKQLNDTYGHEYGDITLKSVAKTIKSCIRESDRLYRYGGEEFVLFFKGISQETVKKIADRIRIAVLENCDVTVTIGVASIQNNVEEAIKQADVVLYLGKTNGKNQINFTFSL
ncbi:MAG: PfkB family carbohydrate kinase [Endomicrobia bacterium]|nr:PfkB family carbohydrate kinase [Endomicrobiia bacterium]